MNAVAAESARLADADLTPVASNFSPENFQYRFSVPDIFEGRVFDQIACAFQDFGELDDIRTIAFQRGFGLTGYRNRGA